jgi:hypothetical protein
MFLRRSWPRYMRGPKHTTPLSRREGSPLLWHAPKLQRGASRSSEPGVELIKLHRLDLLVLLCTELVRLPVHARGLPDRRGKPNGRPTFRHDVRIFVCRNNSRARASREREGQQYNSYPPHSALYSTPTPAVLHGRAPDVASTFRHARGSPNRARDVQPLPSALRDEFFLGLQLDERCVHLSQFPHELTDLRILG